MHARRKTAVTGSGSRCKFGAREEKAFMHESFMNERRTSSYLQRAAADPTKSGDRQFMIECFLDDVRQRPLPPIPPRIDDGLSVRLASWNLNILCGPDWTTPVEAADVASVLREIDADVLALQVNATRVSLLQVAAHANPRPIWHCYSPRCRAHDCAFFFFHSHRRCRARGLMPSGTVLSPNPFRA